MGFRGRETGAFAALAVAVTALPALALGACGRDWSFLDAPPPPDAGAPEAAIPDAAIDTNAPDVQDARIHGDACDMEAPFERLTPVLGVNTAANEEGASLSPDERTIVFARGGDAGSFDLYTAKRGARGEPFDPPSKIEGASTNADDLGAALDPGGLTLYVDSFFVTNAANPGTRHILISTGPGDGTFGVPAPIRTEVTSTSQFYDGMPYLVANGSVMYFASNRNNEDFTVFRSDRGRGSTFVRVDEVLGIDAPQAFDAYPVVADDELAIFFGSDRQNRGAGMRIYFARRKKANVGFEPPTLVDSIDSLQSVGTDARPVWLSSDQCRLYLASNQTDDGGVGSTLDLWVAERTP